MLKDLLERFLRPSNSKRLAFFLVFDTAIVAFSLYLSFLLRFDFDLDPGYSALAVRALPLFIGVKLSVFALFNLSRVTWRYVGIKDLVNVAGAVAASEVVLAAVVLLPRALGGASFLEAGAYGFPRSVFPIDAANTLILLVALRASKRLYLDVFHPNGKGPSSMRTLIVGAGNTGEMILRDMTRNGSSLFRPVGFLDDDTTKVGTYINGLKILGALTELGGAVARTRARAVVIAIPSLEHRTLKDIYARATEAGIETIKIIPRIYDYSRPEVKVRDLESIKVEDLIGRQAVEVDTRAIREFLAGKTVLVTGAGGSIGSEIASQALACGPSRLVLFDTDETELHGLEQRLVKAGGADGVDAAEVSFVVGDLRDPDRVTEVMESYTPEVVFHAAAYKHVPMMESNPNEAVKTNVLGTHALARAAACVGVEKFIMISTDKAVRPTSVMGATKRMAEYVCAAAGRGSGTDFVSVRFGNVLGSRGSVLPLFMEQLKNGGPLTVTHRDMKRYFMTIPEAVSLVLQASVMGRDGEVMVLDMGEPVRIVDLAEELLRLHGLVPYRDVDIEFTGVRPGEKLFEEILTAEEGTTRSRHEKVFRARGGGRFSPAEVEAMVEVLRGSVRDPGGGRTREALRRYVAHFVDPGGKGPYGHTPGAYGELAPTGPGRVHEA